MAIIQTPDDGRSQRAPSGQGAKTAPEAATTAASQYQKILQHLGFGEHDARTVKQDALLILLGHLREVTGRPCSTRDELDALESARCRLARAVGKNPQIATLTEKGALSFTIFAPDSSDALREQSLRTLAKMDKELATKITLLLCKNSRDPNLHVYLGILEEFNQPLQIQVIVETVIRPTRGVSSEKMRAEELRERENILNCLPQVIQQALQAQSSTPLTNSPNLDVDESLKKILPLLGIPATEEDRTLVSNMRYLEDRDKTPNLTLEAITELPHAVQKLASMMLHARQKSDYVVCVAAGMMAANQETVAKAADFALAKFSEIFNRDPDLKQIIGRFFKSEPSAESTK